MGRGERCQLLLAPEREGEPVIHLAYVLVHDIWLVHWRARQEQLLQTDYATQYLASLRPPRTTTSVLADGNCALRCWGGGWRGSPTTQCGQNSPITSPPTPMTSTSASTGEQQARPAQQQPTWPFQERPLFRWLLRAVRPQPPLRPLSYHLLCQTRHVARHWQSRRRAALTHCRDAPLRRRRSRGGQPLRPRQGKAPR